MYIQISSLIVIGFLYYKRIDILQWLCIQNAKYKRYANNKSEIFKIDPLQYSQSEVNNNKNNYDSLFPHVESIEFLYKDEKKKLSDEQENLLKTAIKKWEISLSNDFGNSSTCLYKNIEKSWKKYITTNTSLFDKITRYNIERFPESILVFQNTVLINMTGNHQYIEGDFQNSNTICIRIRSDFNNLILLPC